jgi:hypothetical protein
MKISPEQARNAEAVALVSNSVGQMVKPKGSDRKHFLNEAIDLVPDKLKATRERKATDAVEQPKAEKTLAELLTESAQDSEQPIRQGCTAATHSESSGAILERFCRSRQFLTPFLAGSAFSLP